MNYENIFINGEWVKPDSTEKIEVENPANKEIIGCVPACNETDVNKAVNAAKDALYSWQFTDVKERITLVEELLKELEKRKNHMADTIVKELGSPRDFAKNSQVVPYLSGIKSFIEVMKKYDLEEEHKGYTILKEPVGVVGAITPWNYPLGQITKKVIPALLTGCTVVLKPSQQTPLVSYILAEAIEKVGFPKGVFNLVPGKGADVGTPLADNKDVDMISFTGSTKGGREVSKRAVDDIKRITLELGGKSPAIVLKDADIDLALNKVLDRMYLNTGQTCSALSRLIIPKEDKEKVEEKLIEMTKKYKFGNPNDEGVDVGPLSSKKQFDKVKSYIEKGIEEGATMLLGEVPSESEGYYVSPVVFTDVKNDMEIAQEEIFGPVLCVITYEDVDEAIEIANDTLYGLSAGVFGPDDEASEVSKKIKAGNVSINNRSSTSKSPFGGYKHSGFGREGGVHGIEEYLEIKAVFK